ncbi:MAG: glycosyltransferase [Methanosphaera sp.]|nr:glycosyltransferase [Methanosphaera sp.]
MSECKISIIIPVYNKERYLDKSLQSIIGQSFKDYEVICVDDGSNDLSLTILEEYANEKDNFKVFAKKNEGPGSARNLGLSKASGEYIIFLDADDWLLDDTLEKLYDTATNNNSDLVLFNATEHYKNNITKDRVYHIHLDKNTDLNNFSFDYNNNINLVMNGYHIVCTKLHRLDFIKEHDLKFSDSGMFEDILFHIKSMIYAKRISYNPNKFYQYNRTDEYSRQNSSISTDNSFVLFDIFEEVYDFLQKENLFSKLEINYYKFVINESLNIYTSIKEEYKEELFDKIKYKFTKLNLDNNTLYRLPLNQQSFYISIINSNKNSDVNSKVLFEKTKRKSKIILLKIKNKII